MRRKAYSWLAALAGAALLVCTNAANASPIDTKKNLGWASNRDLTDAAFKQKFDQYRSQGMMPIDVDGYQTPQGTRYSMVWRANPDRLKWAEHRNMTSDGYNERWTQYKNAGYRPVDLDAYRVGSNLRWSGIWVENREGLKWRSNRNLTSKAYGDLFQQMKATHRLVDVEVYQTSNGLRYACIWLENKDNTPWAQIRNMTRDSYQEQVDQRSAQGFHVVDYEAYDTGNGRRYAAIWEKHPGVSFEVRTNRNSTEFANIWRRNRDLGRRLIDFERDGNRYSGVWMETSRRFRYAGKSDLDQKIEAFRTANNLPGISVAVMHQGRMEYRRGFGFADIGRNKRAHGETVYAMASISKVVGGTMAVKLEHRGRLEGGKQIDLDLSRQTSDYLDDLPSHHTHTLENILTHLSCLPYYASRTRPGFNRPRDNNGNDIHYDDDLDAVEAMWDLSLIVDRNLDAPGNQGCTVGQTRQYSSTSFTYLGAAMEAETGKDIHTLVREEIAEPLRLSSMKSMAVSSQLRSNYERAIPYWLDDGNATATTHENKSWKVLGGGLESNVVDLVRFGWAVDRGRVVPAAVRDARLYTVHDPANSSTNAMAWVVDSPGYTEDRHTVSHGGSATGTRTLLVIYPDDDLVIGIMTNVRFDGLSLPSLAGEISDVVFENAPSATPQAATITRAVKPRVQVPAARTQRLAPANRVRPVRRAVRKRGTVNEDEEEG